MNYAALKCCENFRNHAHHFEWRRMVTKAIQNICCWRNFTEHDDVIKRKHSPPYWPFVRGIHRPQVNSPHKGQWRGALMFSLICAWTNVWVNNHSHSAQYDVIVMMTKYGSHTEQSVVSQAGIKDRTGFVPAIDTCFCYNVPQYGTDYIYQACIWYKECCVRNGYQAITSHRICGEWLLVPALDSCLWHNTPHMCVFM